jgi:hypothetical protein
MIVNPEWTEWLEHRAGITRSEIVAVSRLQRGLELGREGREEMDSFGLREIRGFAGVVRLSCPDAPLANTEPAAFHAYLIPYLKRVIPTLFEAAAAVEHLGADEVLFVSPDTREDNGVQAERMVGALLEDLRSAQADLGADYRLRVGLSFGGMYLDRLTLDDKPDWLIMGAPVSIAQALAGSPDLDRPGAFAALFGVGIQEAEKVSFGSLLMALCGPRMTPQPYEELVATAGTTAAAALILPR